MRRFLYAAAGLLVLLGVLLTVIDGLCFAKGFYEYEYQKGAQAEKIGMSEEGLMDATVTLLDYLKDRRDDIVVKTEVHQTEREVYNEREKLHMVDVKQLYQNACTARNLFLLIAAGLFCFLYFTYKVSFLHDLYLGWKDALLLMILFVSFIAIWCIADFNGFWMQFHYIFFDNDLFLLDPNTSIMINMFPESFFFDIVAGIILIFVLVIGICTFTLRHFSKNEAAA